MGLKDTIEREVRHAYHHGRNETSPDDEGHVIEAATERILKAVENEPLPEITDWASTLRGGHAPVPPSEIEERLARVAGQPLEVVMQMFADAGLANEPRASVRLDGQPQEDGNE